MGDLNLRPRRQYLRKETRELVLHVLQKCIEEKNAGRYFHPVTQPMERAEYYSGIPKNTLSIISKVAENQLPGLNEPKTPKHDFLHVKDFDRSLMFECLQETYFSKGKVPFSGPKILAALQERIYFPWGMERFRTLIKEMGYQWQKNGTRHYLVEKPAIAQARSKYLKTIQQYRQQGKHFFFLLLTYFDNNIKMKVMKKVNEEINLINPKHRLILVLSGKGSQFLNGSNLFCKASQTTDDSDADDDMQVATKERIDEWFANVVIPNLPTNSVIIMNNTTHILQKCRIPPRAGSLSQYLNWLKQHKMEIAPAMTREDLYKLIKANKPNFELETIIQKNGQEVMKLPEFIFDLKPIEETWAKVNRVITEHRANSDIIKQGFDCVAEDAIAKVRQIVDNDRRDLDNNLAVAVKEERHEDIDRVATESYPLHLEPESFVKTERESSDVRIKEEIKDEEIDDDDITDSEMSVKMEFESE